MTASGQHRRASSRSLSIFASLAMSFGVGWAYANVSAVAPELAEDYGVSVGAIGYLTMIALVVHALLQLPAGRALDRFGTRSVGAAGLIVIALANLLALAGSSFWLALAGRTILGVGSSLVYLAGLDLVRRIDGSPRLLTMFGVVNGASMGIALLVIPQLDPMLGWRGPFLTSLVLSAVALVATVVGPELAGSAATREVQRRAGATRTATMVLLRDPEIRRLSAINLSASAFSPVISSWIVTLLVEAGGYSTAGAGAIGSISLLGLVASRPLAGWFIHVWPQRVREGIVACTLMGVGGTVGLALVGPLWLAILGSALVGLATGVPWIYVFWRLPSVRPEAAGAALAIVNALPLFVAIAGIPLIGVTFSLSDNGRTGFLIMAVLWGLLVFVLPARGRGPGAEPG